MQTTVFILLAFCLASIHAGPVGWSSVPRQPEYRSNRPSSSNTNFNFNSNDNFNSNFLSSQVFVDLFNELLTEAECGDDTDGEKKTRSSLCALLNVKPTNNAGSGDDNLPTGVFSNNGSGPFGGQTGSSSNFNLNRNSNSNSDFNSAFVSLFFSLLNNPEVPERLKKAKASRKASTSD